MAYKVLLVENDNFMRKYIKGTLVREGYNVHDVKTAEESITQINGNDYQIMLMNVDLPGADTLKLIKIFRDLKPTLNSIAMAGKKSTSTADECRRAGFDDYFKQPFKLDIFLRSLDRVIDGIQRLTHILENETWNK